MFISLEIIHDESIMEMRRVFEHDNSILLPFNELNPSNPVVANREDGSGCVCYRWSCVVLAVD